jgi:hypothetical protein
MLQAFKTKSQPWCSRLLLGQLVCWCALATLVGCGTTRTTDTGRTATEQLLISDAIDRAVESVHVQILAGQKVFLKDEMVKKMTDSEYLIGSVRQHLLANGCVLKDSRDEADYVVEIRAGAIGTDRNDLLFGIPAFQVPQFVPLATTVPAAIPEIPFAKRSQQRGVAKIALFAYEAKTGDPVWQSGLAMQQSSASDIWVFGTGPYQKGSIYTSTQLAGGSLINPLGVADSEREKPTCIASEAVFQWPALPGRPEQAIASEPPADEQVQQADHKE